MNEKPTEHDDNPFKNSIQTDRQTDSQINEHIF